jgi:hypothetical protein
MKNLHLFLLLVIFSFLSISCGSSSSMALNSSEKIKELNRGMSYDQVVNILGNPKSTQLIDNNLIARWTLQEMWVGYVPYDVVFNAKTKELISWSKNEADFAKTQEKLKMVSEVMATAEEEMNKNGSSGNGNASATGPNDENLMRQFAVKLFRFSGSGGGTTGGSETTINLCPNGRFTSGGESGYSGSGWGTASENGDHGSWRIQGNMQEGEIVFVHSNGKAWKYHYTRAQGDYVTLDGTKYGLNGRPDCGY